ncbi:glycosyltransferase family A protein [Nocardia pseudobrasiliensis]|nr:glycosyltransferase family A protein [Nocardia pseudobrasiliensis]
MQVDVVTAVHGGYACYLPAAWRSLCAQTHPDWRWLLQIDGPSAEVLAELESCGAADDPRIYLGGNVTQEGPATTRNVALGRARAPLVQNLDADDELEPTALATLAEALAVHPDAGFAVGPARDLMDSGELVDFPFPFPPGPLPRGALVDAWVTDRDNYRLPVVPAAVMWRRSLLLAAGGWAGLRNMEDTGLLMAGSALAPGAVVDTIVLRYRKHHGQRTKETLEFNGWAGQISLIRRRAATLLAGPGWNAEVALV